MAFVPGDVVVDPLGNVAVAATASSTSTQLALGATQWCDAGHSLCHLDLVPVVYISGKLHGAGHHEPFVCGLGVLFFP